MRILVGNNHLDKTGGTESYTFALATILKDIGYEVEYFTFHKGLVSEKLERYGIPFMSHNYYDLILANHTSVVEHLFLHGFVIQTCHGVIPDLEQPSPFADMYVSISEEVRTHLQHLGVESDVMLNGIDCERFAPNIPIHQNLTCVLSLCQSDAANNFIKECCDSMSGGEIEFILCNKFTDNVWEIEKQINRADLVVGIGRSLYDAMACGRCVISYDFRPYHNVAIGDGYITKNNIYQSIAYNCSGRGLNRTFTKEEFITELKKYNPDDGKWARSFALENLNMREAARRYIEYYDRCIMSEILLNKLAKTRALNTVKETSMAAQIAALEKNMADVCALHTTMNTRITVLEENLLRINKKRKKYLKILRAIAYVTSSLVFLTIILILLTL